MTADAWARIKEIFGDAIELEPEQREAFVRDAAAGDPEIIGEVLRLIAETQRDTGLLSHPAVAFVKVPSATGPPQFSAPAVLAGRFRIARFIAHGGMGEVYEAEDLELGERVALKVIRPGAAPSQVLLALFKSEIQLARRVTHPNVCRVYDLAQHQEAGEETPTTLLSMELVQGHTLAEHLKQHGAFAWKDALPLIEQIGAGIQAAHDAGIIHGDLKPANVILAPAASGPRAVVMDFGLAIPLAQAGKERKLGGTPGYLAPEQERGEPLTTATDVYAFGLIVAEMLGAGRPPKFQPESASMPSAWARALEICFRRQPEQRYARAADLVELLKASLGGRRKSARQAALALAVVATAAGGLALARRAWTAGKPTVQQLFTESDGEAVWSASPNGRWLSETLWDTGDLALRDTRNGKVRRLTHKPTSWQSSPGGAWGAVFSPDNRNIVYRWNNSRLDGEIRIIGIDGKGGRLLYKDPNVVVTPLDWSPDGQRVLVRLGSDPQLATISVGNGSLTRLNGSQTGRARRAMFSPDSGSVVFDVTQAGRQSVLDIHRLNLGGAGVESSLIEHPANDSLIGWSPDRRLIFSSDRSGQTGIWAVAVSVRGVEGDPQELRPQTGGIEPLGITRDGSLYYRLEAESANVYTAVLDLAVARMVSAPKPVVARFTGIYEYPNWSNDGSRLVFSSRQDVLKPELGVHRLAEAVNTTMVPVDLAYVWRPQWISSGKSIVAIGQAKDGYQGHFEIDPVTGAARRLLSFSDVGGAGEGVWSADGGVMFNRYSDWRRGLFSLNVKTGQRTVLYVPPDGVDLGLENLALSPDGRTLAFHARNDAAGTASLMLVPADGRQEARALWTISRPDVFRYGSFTWTPDSREILAARSRGEISEIWRVAVDGAPPVKIDFPAMWVNSLRLNPDGKTIAFTNVKHRSEIWVLESFLK